MKNPGKLLFLCLVILANSCFKPIPRIYNEGTAYKMPRNLETSDFYKDIETLFQYDGSVQDYFVKLKSFLWVNENNPNYKIESVFYFIKQFPSDNPNRYEYSLQFRRYITVENEEIDSSIIKEITANKNMFEGRFCTLFFGGNSDFIDNRYAHARRWGTSNGKFENYGINLWYELKNGNLDYGEYIFNYILKEATVFEIHFAEDIEHFVEIDNNIISLTDEEFEVFRQELNELSKQKKKTVEEYAEYVMNQDLR